MNIKIIFEVAVRVSDKIEMKAMDSACFRQ
jgi:hypothetical protein